MPALAGLLIGAGAIAWGAWILAGEIRQAREDASRARTLATDCTAGANGSAGAASVTTTFSMPL